MIQAEQSIAEIGEEASTARLPTRCGSLVVIALLILIFVVQRAWFSLCLIHATHG